jgi:hypothetical protein
MFSSSQACTLAPRYTKNNSENTYHNYVASVTQKKKNNSNLCVWLKSKDVRHEMKEESNQTNKKKERTRANEKAMRQKRARVRNETKQHH